MQSCGYAVPYYAFQGHRTKLLDFYEKRELADRATNADCPPDNGLRAYWALKNLKSIDGLEGLSSAHKSNVIPQCDYDRVKEACKVMQNDVNLAETYWISRGNIKFVAGLSLGLLVSAIYVRLGGIV